MESTAKAEVGDAASAGRTAASEGEMKINNTNIKTNRDMIIFLNLAIAIDDFDLVILKLKIDLFQY